MLPADVVDLDRYPLVDEGCQRRVDVVAAAHTQLRDDGCSILRDFIRSDRLEAVRRECSVIADRAHDEFATVNVYNTDPDADLPHGHPGRVEMRRENAFVAQDRIPEDLVIHRLYRWPPFQRFVADCLELPQLHPLADPFAGLCLNVVRPGRWHPWHFDTNEFAVSMVTQEPQSGGEFGYCPAIRSAGRENLEQVHAVITGEGDHLIKRVRTQAGDLQLFRGRYSLHRVSEVGGDVSRHAVIFSYSERPGLVGSAVRTRQLFGRVAPDHLEARDVRVDELLD